MDEYLMPIWRNPGTGEIYYPASYVDRLRQLLRAVQTDAGNWLNTDLQYAIEAEVGKPGSYRDLADSGVPPLSAEPANEGTK